MELLLPVAVGDYTDFFTSLHHTKNCGLIFRGPQTPVLDNWCVDLKDFTNLINFFSVTKKLILFHRYRLPVAYHGRASSVVISGTDIVRPR